MHGQNSKVRFPFRVNGCTVIEQYTGSDWKFGDDYFNTNDLFVPVYPKNKPADFDHSETFGSRDTPWYIKVSLNVFPESKEIRDALYTLSTSFFEGDDWCMVVCSPSFLEDSARKISLDPVLKQYPGVKPLVLEWLDLTAIYDFAQDVLLDADVWPSIDHPYGDYGSSNSCIGNYIFDDTDFGYLSDEELDRPFRGQEIVVDDVIST